MNFIIVETTPIETQNIGWKFWIIRTMFNAAFLPVIYFFYPETDTLSLMLFFLRGNTYLESVIVNRTLEDIDAYYRSNPSLIVVKEPHAISVKRPLNYIEHEYNEMNKIGEIRTKKADSLMMEYVE